MTLACRAATFYVDNEATGAGDGSSWTNAWADFGSINWSDIKPGDTLLISGGRDSKTYTGSLIVGKSGVAGQPISIAVPASDPDHSGTVVLEGGHFDLVNQKYITISGNSNGDRHLRLQNFFSTQERTFGNAVLADATQGVVLEYVEVFNVNQMISLVGATQFIVRHCAGTEIRGDAAVRAVNCYGTGFDANLVENNTFELARDKETGYGPDGVQGSNSLTIRNNRFTVKNVDYFTSEQHTDYCQVTGNYIIISGNEFVNIGDSGIDMDWWANPAPHDIWIYNNVFRITGDYDPYPEYIRFYSSGGTVTGITNMKIFNNTFLDNPWLVITGPGGNAASAACTGFEIKNNIFINPGSVFWIPATPNFDEQSCSFANNVYSGGSILYRGTNYNIGATWPLVEPTRINGRPEFVCYISRSSANDLRLSFTDSVAKSAGEDLSEFFGTDKDGTIRPAGSAWDIGAYQAQSTPAAVSPPVITQQPTNLDRFLGTQARFQVAAQGDSLSYQWRFNDTELPGATSSEFVIPSIKEGGLGRYTVQISNASGCVLSDPAQLSLYIDSDADGLTDQWERGVGRYKVIPGAFTWTEAKTDAEARGGHLATVLSDAEWQAIKQVVPEVLDEPRWIGLWREAESGEWKWVTGEPFDYAVWAAERPNTSAKNMAVVELTPTAAWKDTLESDAAQHSYLLEIGYYTDPLNADSDGDGFSDGEETNFYHTLPTSPVSKPRFILDNSTLSASGAFLFYANGVPGTKYRVESSTNLVDWVSFLDLTLPLPTVPLGDYGPATLPGPRFYRAVPVP